MIRASLAAALQSAWDWLRQESASNRRSLRGRLLYTLVALLIALLALELVTYSLRVNRRQAAILSEQTRYTATLASACRANLDRLVTTEHLIAYATRPDRVVAGDFETLMRATLAEVPAAQAIQVISPSRATVASWPPRAAPPAEAPPFFYTLTPRTPLYTSAAFSDPSRPERRVRIASLATEDDEPVGIVSIEFRTGGAGPLLPPSEAEHAAKIADANGEVVFATPGAGSIGRDSVVRALRQAPRGATATQIEGIGAARISGTSWILLTGRPSSETLEELTRDARTSVLLLGLVILILGAGMVLVLRFSLQPVFAVSAGARLLGAGDLSLRLPPTQVEEFEQVVEAFNRMAGQLEAARNDLVEANRDLEERVRERTAALEEEHRRVRAAERLSTLGLLSSAIAHDLRNPLNNIGLAAQSLELRLANSPDEKLAERLEMIRRELARAERIIRTLLAFARTGEPARQPTDLNALVREVTGIIDLPPDVAIRLDLQDDLPAVPLDRDQLFQVLENLIRNAIQVMPDGGEVVVATAAAPDACSISVSDSGPGVPDDMQSAIFEPLVTTRTTGTGLGLALAKRIVEAHSGRIWLESAPGHGATFRILLPVGGEGRRTNDDGSRTTDDGRQTKDG